MIDITIQSNPLALKRHRDSIRNGRRIKYDPSAEDKKNFLWKCIANDIVKSRRPLTGPIKITMVFYMKRPKSHYGTGKNSNRLKKNAPKIHTSKPDIDNLAKFVLDALNKVYWIDDAQVYCLICKKVYHHIPITSLKIEEININH